MAMGTTLSQGKKFNYMYFNYSMAVCMLPAGLNTPMTQSHCKSFSEFRKKSLHFCRTVGKTVSDVYKLLLYVWTVL